MKRWRDPAPGDVLVVGEKHRRVVVVLGGGVVYSVGSDKNRVCKVATFKRWARKASLVHEASAAAENALKVAPAA